MQTVANLCLRLNMPDGIKSLDMGLDQIAKYVQGLDQIVPAWGKNAVQVAFNGINIGLIDSDPEITEVVQFRNDTGDITHEEGNVCSVGKTAAFSKPERIGKMMQGYNRF